MAGLKGTLLASRVDQVLEQINSWVVVNSECTTGLTQRSFESYSRRFAERLLANPSMADELEVPPVYIAKYIRKVLDELDPKVVTANEANTVAAILSNPRLVHMVREARDLGQLWDISK